MPKARSESAAPLEAVVARVDFGSCILVPDRGSAIEATVRGRVMGPTKALGNAVVVGDRVDFVLEHGRGVLTGIRPRRNIFSRRASGVRPVEQVVAANLDQVVMVASLVDPEFKPGFADRVLCQAEHAGIPARLVINKTDLGDAASAAAILEDYARAGYPGHRVSAKTGEGIDHVRFSCRGRRSLMVGHSGVGKSTLLNALVPGLTLMAGHVNPKTGKGRHTTTAAWLIRSEPDLELIDTPGLRSFSLWGIGPRDLDQAYPEFRRYLGECRFTDCTHVGEPDCAIKGGVDSGVIARRRYDSFRKLRDELEQESARV